MRPKYLIFAIIICNLVFIPIVVFYVIESFYDTLIENDKITLLSDLDQISEKIVSPKTTKDLSKLTQEIKTVGMTIMSRITIIDLAGNVLVDSQEDPKQMDNHADRPEVFEAINQRTGFSVRYSKTLKMYMIYIAKPVKLADGSTLVLRIAKPTVSREQIFWKNLNYVTCLGLLAVLFNIFVFVSLYFYHKRLTSKLLKSVISLIRSDTYLGVEVAELGQYGEIVSEIYEINENICELKNRIETFNVLFGAFSKLNFVYVFITDPNGVIITNNGKLKSLFPELKSNITGLHFIDVFRAQKVKEIFSQLSPSRVSITETISFQTPEGEVPMDVSFTILSKDQQNIQGVLIEMLDLREVNALRRIADEFLANVSHEIMTPLTAIKGFVETLCDEGLEDKDQAIKFLVIVRDQVKRLEDTLNGVLLLTRLKAKRQEIELSECNIRQLINEIVVLYEEVAQRKGIRLEVVGAEEVSFRVNPVLLRQAILNLIDNAIKFSPENSRVDIGYDCLEGLRIWVKDEGPGIDKSEKEKIFDRFYKGQSSKSMPKGAGLGLAIVKAVAEAHGGKVKVEDNLERGSLFAIWIPKR